MIIKGKAAGSVGYWSSHLLRDDTNEKAVVREIRGLLAENVPEALKEMQAVASGSRSQGNFMYQANINPLAHEHLTPEQWREAVDTLERNLGFEGHQRVVVEHIKDGRQHYHIIWNRVDVDTMRVASITGNYAAHERTARQLEQKFELVPLKEIERGRAWELWEQGRGEQSGNNIHTMKAELTELWRASDSGKAFKAAIEDRGYILAKGDRRDFCVVDRTGDAHSLARRLDGVRAAAVREKMSDVDRDALPTVIEAQAMQHDGLRLETGKTQFQDSARTQFYKTQSRTSENQHVPQSEISIDPSVTKAASVIGKVADIAISILSGPEPPPRAEDIERRSEQLLVQRREAAAWQAVRENIDQGKALTPEILRSLGRNHLENIAASGDAYIMQVLSSMNRRDADHNHDRGRTRER